MKMRFFILFYIVCYRIVTFLVSGLYSHLLAMPPRINGIQEKDIKYAAQLTSQVNYRFLKLSSSKALKLDEPEDEREQANPPFEQSTDQTNIREVLLNLHDLIIEKELFKKIPTSKRIIMRDIKYSIDSSTVADCHIIQIEDERKFENIFPISFSLLINSDNPIPIYKGADSYGMYLVLNPSMGKIYLISKKHKGNGPEISDNIAGGSSLSKQLLHNYTKIADRRCIERDPLSSMHCKVAVETSFEFNLNSVLLFREKTEDLPVFYFLECDSAEDNKFKISSYQPFTKDKLKGPIINATRIDEDTIKVDVLEHLNKRLKLEKK